MRKQKEMQVTTLGASRLVQGVLRQAVQDLERRVPKDRDQIRWHKKNAIETLKWVSLNGSTFTFFCEAFDYDVEQIRKKVVVLADRKLRRITEVKRRIHIEQQAKRDRERARILSQTYIRGLQVRNQISGKLRPIRPYSGEGQRSNLHTGQTPKEEIIASNQQGVGSIQEDKASNTVHETIRPLH